MSTLVGSEFLKLRTTRGWIGYVLPLRGRLGGARDGCGARGCHPLPLGGGSRVRAGQRCSGTDRPPRPGGSTLGRPRSSCRSALAEANGGGRRGEPLAL